MLGLAGVTAIDCSVAAVTVSVVFPEILAMVAVMSDDPAAALLARPLAVIVATAVVPEVQMTEDVMSCVVPSEYEPVALNGSAIPTATLGLAGVTAIDSRVAVVTVRAAAPEMLPDVAVMTDEPAVTLVASPLAEIVATEAVPEVHVAEEAMTLEVPSE